MGEAIERISGVMGIDAAMLLRSWARGGGGGWSDIDLIDRSRGIATVPILERYRLVVEVRPPRTGIFIYTLEELERMIEMDDPSALSALAEGVPPIASSDVKKLMGM